MKVSIKYFASIRETMGMPGETLDTEATSLRALRDELIARNQAGAQALARGRAVRLALNQTMSDESAPLTAGAEIAFFPPVTGG